MDFDLKRVIIFVLAAFIALLAVYKIFDKQNIRDHDKEEESSVLFEPVLSDTLETVLYYEDDKKYYLYGLEEVMITYQDETKSLKEFLNDGVSIEDLVSQLDHYSVYDGGSNLYRDGKDDGVSILVCHRLISSGGYNEDVYIGNSDMGYEEGFCE